ncbi:MAG: HAD hydrolase family protein, partial [Cardiobacteriaceae bacterium]|nr:HAD hydrolase family protein [Cardiobacteriaceae bacterium]
MQPKIVFFDIDDTLFRKWQNFLPDSVLPALRALQKAGIMVAVATGRSPCAIPAKVRALLDEIGLDVLVSINGQFNQYRGQTIASHPMDIADVSDFITFFQQQGWEYGVISEEKMALSSDLPRVHDALYGTVPYEVDRDYYHHHAIYQMNT